MTRALASLLLTGFLLAVTPLSAAAQSLGFGGTGDGPI